jgi:hypothetical protein
VDVIKKNPIMLFPFLVATGFAFAMFVIAYQFGFSTLFSGEAYIILIGKVSGSRYASVGDTGFARYTSLVNLVFYFDFALYILASRFYKNIYKVKLIVSKRAAHRIEFVFWISLAMMVMNVLVYLIFLS